MAVQRIRIWQWVLIALVVGVGVGYVWIDLQSDLEGPGSEQATKFFALLQAKTDKGEPRVRDVVIDPVRLGPKGEKIQRVRFTLMLQNRETKQYDPVPRDTLAGVPYINLRSQKDPRYQSYFQKLSERKNPTVAAEDNRVSDYLDYLKEQGTPIAYSRSFTQVSPVEATIANEDPKAGWITKIGYAFRRGIPADRELHWWQNRTFAWLLSIGGSVLFIGVLWPLAIKAMVKMGLGLPEEEAMDLSKVSSASAPTLATSGASASDRQDLDDLNAQMEANVAGMLVTDTDLDDEVERKAEEAAIKKLEATRLETQETLAGPAKPKDYAGEFYPVAKPRGDTP